MYICAQAFFLKQTYRKKNKLHRPCHIDPRLTSEVDTDERFNLSLTYRACAKRVTAIGAGSQVSTGHAG
jgi:hypothetical protein